MLSSDLINYKQRQEQKVLRQLRFKGVDEEKKEWREECTII
jgi:hypothetical protein